MKLSLSLVLLLILTACSTQQHTTADKKSTAVIPASAHKMASYFQESKSLNGATAVNQIIDAALKDPSNPEPLYALGYLHMQSGINSKNARELDLAEIYLNEVLTKFPGNQVVLQALYTIYYDNTYRNRSPKAFDNAKAIFAQFPEASRTTMNPPSLAKFASTLIQQEKDRQPNRQLLREILLQAIQESPQADSAYVHLAKIYRDDHYFPLAIATLKLGEENIQASADLYKALADTYVKRAEVSGCNYEHTSDIQNAAKYYQLAVPLTPENQALHFSLSETLFDQNKFQLGLNETVIALDLKTSSESLGVTAQNFSNLGYHTQALTFLQQAIAQGYSQSDAGYHEIYMNKGDWKNAAAGFTAYIKSHEKFSVYDLMKSDIIAQQAQTPSLLANKKVTIGSQWEQALYNYWGENSSADDLKKVALTRCEKTEYYFYTGYKDLQAGQTAQANTKFTAALNQNTYRFIERPLARYFLQKTNH